MRDDYYNFDELSYSAIGEKLNKKYTIGDKVLVRVKNANPMLSEIDFNLIKKI